MENHSAVRLFIFLDGVYCSSDDNNWCAFLKETHLLLLVVDMATNLWGFPSCDVGGFPPTDYWL